MSKIFGVSVGWLLGTEKDPSFDPSTGLSDSQLKMVEQIASNYQPPHKRFYRILLSVMACLFAVVVLLGVYYHRQITALYAENADMNARIAALADSSQSIHSQIDGITNLIEVQGEAEKILSNFGAVCHAADDLQRVLVDFYCVPKLFQENATAYISIMNPDAGVNEMLQCAVQGGSYYWVRAELPVANNYKYSFLLVTDGGYREQMISTEGSEFFVDLHSAMNFHADSVDIRSEWNCNETVYTYTTPIYSPIIPTDNYVGYEEIIITLRHNDNSIWQKSFREEFRELGGAYMRSELPMIPDIEVQLPPLTPGDSLTLEITAECYGGQILTNTLEALEVVNKP